MSYIKSNLLFEELLPEAIYQFVSPPILISDKLKSPENMGAMIRLALNIAASKAIFLGEEPLHHITKLQRVATASHGKMEWFFTQEMDLRKLIEKPKTIVALETASNATSLFATELPDNAAFIVGNERFGMRPEILEQADMVVYIPVPGLTRSLNVSHSAAILLFEWYRQMEAKYLKTNLST